MMAEERRPFAAALDGVLDDAVILEWIAVTVAGSKRLAYNKTEAAAALGVSVEFFDAHIDGEVYVVKRGRRQIYPLAGLLWWLWKNSKRPDQPQVPPSAD